MLHINLPIGDLVAAGVFIFLHLPQTPRGQFGKDCVAIGSSWHRICFILVLQYGGTSHLWNSSQVIGMLIGFNVALPCLF